MVRHKRLAVILANMAIDREPGDTAQISVELPRIVVLDDDRSLRVGDHVDHFVGMQTKGRPVSGSRFRATEFPIQNIDNAYASKTMFEIGTPCGPWRAPGSNTSAFVSQSFLAEMAHAAGRDYVEFLLEIVGEPRWFQEGNIRSLNTGRAADVIKIA